MKVKFIKGNRFGEEVEADEKRAAYWQRMGLVEEVYEVQETKPIKKAAKSKKKGA
jgi:hypothetical protein